MKPEAPKTQTDPSNQDLLDAITSIRTSLESRIDTVAIEVTLIRENMKKITDRMSAVEHTTTDLSEETSQLKQQITQLRSTQEAMSQQLDDYEGRMRRNNVRIIGVPERVEGQAADLFVEELILKHLCPKGLSKYFSIERAHRCRAAVRSPERTLARCLPEYSTSATAT